jgi:hypothetical protein
LAPSATFQAARLAQVLEIMTIKKLRELEALAQELTDMIILLFTLPLKQMHLFLVSEHKIRLKTQL